jgi:hypothetical protein
VQDAEGHRDSEGDRSDLVTTARDFFRRSERCLCQYYHECVDAVSFDCLLYAQMIQRFTFLLIAIGLAFFPSVEYRVMFCRFSWMPSSFFSLGTAFGAGWRHSRG